MLRQAQGPGVVKVRQPRPVASRVLALVRADDSLWAGLFDKADVVSEGRAQQEGDGEVYRGTTSILLSSSNVPVASTQDPHLRLRAMRIAHREAQVRSSGSLGPIQMDMVVRVSEKQVCIHIEVEAQVEEAGHSRRVPGMRGSDR
jgi:hypothetical protein